MNKKILVSLSVIGAVAAIAVGGTIAFFSDTETSQGNTFTAGGLDLTVDSECHYYNYVGEDAGANGDGYVDVGCRNATSTLFGTWAATDLGVEHQFFNFSDIKPGDKGENTISLHVDNDAWLRLLVSTVTDDDNDMTEPESLVDLDPLSGELRENLLFSVWLDWGEDEGFQGRGEDEGEGDNIQNYQEPTIISEGTINAEGETWDLADAGLYLYGGETAYFGLAWELPSEVGNEVQTDSMSATMEFQVQQHRNNPSPDWDL